MSKNGMHAQKGFSLIELLVVVVIIGIVASQAVPGFVRSTIKTKQAEAKTILKQIYSMEMAYRQEKASYWVPPAGTVASAANPSAFLSISVEIIPSARYSYTITSSDGGSSNFVATALCGVLDDDAAVDQWTIDQNGDLQVTPGMDDADN